MACSDVKKPSTADVRGVHRVGSGSCLVYFFHDGVVLFVIEVELDELDSRLIYLLVLMVLQLLEVVQEAVALSDDGERVEPIFEEVLLATLKDVADALDRDGDDVRLLDLHALAQSLDQALVDHLLELRGFRDGSGVAQRPDGLHLDRGVVMDENLAQLINQTAVNAALQLITVSGSQVGKDPADLLADRLLLVLQRLSKGLHQAGVDQLLGLLVSSCGHIADSSNDGDLH